MEPLRKLRARLASWFSGLSSRERIMVVLVGSAAILFVFGLFFSQLQRRIGEQEEAIDRKTHVLAQVGKLAQGYRQAQADRAQFESKLRGPPVQLMSFVAQAGKKIGVEVSDLRPGMAAQTAPSDKVSEDTVEVNLARLDLFHLTSLLQELERGPGVVKVRRISMRTRVDDPTMIDVTIVVATYQLKG